MSHERSEAVPPVKIVVADPISERGLELLAAPGWRVETPPPEALAAALAAADALIVRSATRVIGRAGVGVDNIDLDAATERGVLVMNTPGGNAVSVAEHTLALLLALARRIPQLDAAARAGRWEKSAAGVELRGKTLGLVGLGRIGREVARRARALEMRLLAFDPYLAPDVVREAGAEPATLEDLLASSDFVSLHAALSPATDKMIHRQSLARMKPGAFLINTARGELVDEAALAEALGSGHLAGAALDVFATEPPLGSPLLGLPNVIATPHVAGSTREAQEEVGVAVAQQVRDYLADGTIRNAVNLPAVSAEQYRRLRPYLDLGERLGRFVAQASAGRLERLAITCAGEPAELGTSLVRNAVLGGLLASVTEESVNLVNASRLAQARGLVVEETTRRRELGFPNTLEVAATSDGTTLVIEGTVLAGTSPRVLSIDGIALEAPLEGTLLFTRNRDVPGVIGRMGTVLGAAGINIATFALGRRAPVRGAEALALVRLDGEVPDAILEPVRQIEAVTAARLIRLPESV